MKTFSPPEFSIRWLYCDSDRIRTKPPTTLIRNVRREGVAVAMRCYALQDFACSECSRQWKEAVER